MQCQGREEIHVNEPKPTLNERELENIDKYGCECLKDLTRTIYTNPYTNKTFPFSMT